MASQISHIAYGQKFIEKHLINQKIDRKKFFTGTLFPDIRYLGSLSRETTHLENIDLDRILDTKDDFQRGMMVHNYVDIEREKTVHKLGISNIIDYDGYATSVIKFIEDEFTYPLIKDWSQYINIFEDVLPEEIKIATSPVAKKWHRLLQSYFSQPPTFDTVTLFAQELQSFTPEVIAKAKEVYLQIKSNPQAMTIISQTYYNTFV